MDIWVPVTSRVRDDFNTVQESFPGEYRQAQHTHTCTHRKWNAHTTQAHMVTQQTRIHTAVAYSSATQTHTHTHSTHHTHTIAWRQPTAACWARKDGLQSRRSATAVFRVQRLVMRRLDRGNMLEAGAAASARGEGRRKTCRRSALSPVQNAVLFSRLSPTHRTSRCFQRCLSASRICRLEVQP